MAESKNYYQILHVQSDAPEDVIRSTYRTMMQKMKMHPDLGGDEKDAALLNEAYAVLMDPVARAKYDESLTRPASKQRPQGPAVSSQNVTVRRSRKIILDPKSCAFCNFPHELNDQIKPDDKCPRCGSALYPASKQVQDKNGHRLIRRIEKQWPVTFYTQWPITRGYIAKTKDVSLNGIQVDTSYLVKKGQIVKLTCHMLDAVAVVKNVRQESTLLRKRWRVGLEFVSMRFHQAQGTFIKTNI